VMRGYWQNDAANQEVFQDHWFKSGDLFIHHRSQERTYCYSRRKERCPSCPRRSLARPSPCESMHGSR
jgi:acyl-CoA synthetase (AMP-forming)/AMP-acid ligase II